MFMLGARETSVRCANPRAIVRRYMTCAGLTPTAARNVTLIERETSQYVSRSAREGCAPVRDAWCPRWRCDAQREVEGGSEGVMVTFGSSNVTPYTLAVPWVDVTHS